MPDNVTVLKRKLVLYFICIYAMLLLFSGCPTAGDGGYVFEKKNIWMIVEASPVEQNVAVGPTQYQDFCTFEDMTAQNGHIDLSDTLITINGIELVGGPSFFHSLNIGQLSQGDRVAFHVYEKRLGDIQYDLIVPASVPTFTLTPSLPLGSINNVGTYTMSWEPNGAAKYGAGYTKYDLPQTYKKGITYISSFISNTFTSPELDLNGCPAPFLDFFLRTYASKSIPDFDPMSSFELSGTNVVIQTNR